MTDCPSCSRGRDGFLVRETLELSSTDIARSPREDPARLFDPHTAWL